MTTISSPDTTHTLGQDSIDHGTLPNPNPDPDTYLLIDTVSMITNL